MATSVSAKLAGSYCATPSEPMAQLAKMSTAAFEDFYFDVCTMDYRKMSRAMQPLKHRMEAANRVEIIGPGTELSFSIKGIPAVACDGKLNIPDGEVFTAPVRDSINGMLQYNAPTIYQGVPHEHIRLEFKDGKIIDATSNNTVHLNSVLDSDGGRALLRRVRHRRQPVHNQAHARHPL